MYPIERVVAAPKDTDQTLEICSDLVWGAIRSSVGNVLVFLPGMGEIQRLRSFVRRGRKRGDPKNRVIRLHSDALGNEEKEQSENEMDDGNDETAPRLIYISSVIAARGITLDDIRCVIIHPHCRKNLAAPVWVRRARR